MMTFTDKTLMCSDCGANFIFTTGEQEFFAEKGYENYPKRCSSCRESRRSKRESGERREMFSVVCSLCGGDARVPFQPRTDKPVYCATCFGKVRSLA